VARTSAWTISLVLQLCVLTYVVHRAGVMPTGLAMTLFAVAGAGALVSFGLAATCLLTLWRKGGEGAGIAGTAAALSALLLCGAAAAGMLAVRLPPINDISTDTAEPPRFDIISTRRPAGANATQYSASTNAALQQATWPDLVPIDTRRSAQEAYAIALMVANRLSWRVVAAGAPGQSGPNGEFEATDRTLIMGFTDDIAVRVTPNGEVGARIDARSASRYGTYDYGRNAERLRFYLSEVKSAIEAAELTTSGG
jgi:Protein of unknown function (DUF1499)